MVYNQDLSRDNTADINESFRVLKENKIITVNSPNIAKNIKTTCIINKAFSDSIMNNQITAKAWGQR